MAIAVGLDLHRAQITFDWIDPDTGEHARGQIRRPTARRSPAGWRGSPAATPPSPWTQVRGAAEPFHPKLLAFLAGNSEVLERLVTEMYARGLSTRDVEDCFRDSTGELVISRSAVSEITDRLWEDFQAFQTRDLGDLDVEYLFVDAIVRHEALRNRVG